MQNELHHSNITYRLIHTNSFVTFSVAITCKRWKFGKKSSCQVQRYQNNYTYLKHFHVHNMTVIKIRTENSCFIMFLHWMNIFKSFIWTECYICKTFFLFKFTNEITFPISLFYSDMKCMIVFQNMRSIIIIPWKWPPQEVMIWNSSLMREQGRRLRV